MCSDVNYIIGDGQITHHRSDDYVMFGRGKYRNSRCSFWSSTASRARYFKWYTTCFKCYSTCFYIKMNSSKTKRWFRDRLYKSFDGFTWCWEYNFWWVTDKFRSSLRTPQLILRALKLSIMQAPPVVLRFVGFELVTFEKQT